MFLVFILNFIHIQWCSSALIDSSISDDEMLCLVSKELNNTDALPYPDIYFPSHPSMVNGSYYNCSSFDPRSLSPRAIQIYSREKVPLEHKCLPSLCPMKPQYIKVSKSVMDWKPRIDSLCHLQYLQQHQKQHQKQKQKQHNPPIKVNVIVFGGSMTYGKYMLGACCLNPENYSSPCNNLNGVDMFLNSSKYYCSWFDYLSHWMRREYRNVKFKFYNMALSGTSSVVMAGEISRLFVDYKITLTKYDLIFLDHSCNDVLSNAGLEPLVREIFNYVHNTHLADFDDVKKANYPTLIVSEQYMQGRQRDRPYNPKDMKDYRTDYRIVSRAYQLLYFSFSEITWSEFLPSTPSSTSSATSNSSSSSSERIESPFFRIIRSYEFHSPWHVHLFIADHLAGFIQSVIKQYCPLNSSSLSSFQSTHPIVPLIPVTLTGQNSEQFMCDSSLPPLVSSRPHSTFRPKNLTKFESTLTNGWEDFIDVHQQPGWIITKYSNSSNRTMSFPFDLAKIQNLTSENVVLRIQYLKTYHNAGFFEISVCSKTIENLDTLFAHQTGVRISVPHWYSKSLNRDFFQKNCRNLGENPPEIKILFHTRVMGRFRDLRGTFKVKIYAVEMCVQQNIENADNYYTTPPA